MISPNIISISNRKLCDNDFYEQLERIGKSSVKSLILREKDLFENGYRELAGKVIEIARAGGWMNKLIFHTFYKVALDLQLSSVHMPLHLLKEMSENERAAFKVLGASCHSVEDALLAESLGCTYITAGHVFDTDCKKGLPGRGLEFLESVCKAVKIPVYAIGGISAENYRLTIEKGAAGVCIMSGLMKADNVDEYLNGF